MSVSGSDYNCHRHLCTCWTYRGFLLHWSLGYFLPSRWCLNSCMILGGKETIFQIDGCHSKSLPLWCFLHMKPMCPSQLPGPYLLPLHQVDDTSGWSFYKLSPHEEQICSPGGWPELSQTCVHGMKLTDRYELNPNHCQLHWESKIISPHRAY